MRYAGHRREGSLLVSCSRFSLIRLLFAATILGSTILSSAGASAAGKVTEPDWVSKPDGDQIADAYPPMAVDLDIEGRVVVACQTTAEGILKNCKVHSETPKALGFGEAGLALTSYFRVSPRTIDGRGVAGGEVRIPINFKAPPAEPALVLGPPTSPRAMELATQLVSALKVAEQHNKQPIVPPEQYRRWTRIGVSPAALHDGLAALEAANLAAVTERQQAEAKLFAAEFSTEELSARLTYIRSDAGKAELLRSFDYAALTAAANWVIFRQGIVFGRQIYCETHSCQGPPLVSTAIEPPADILTPDWIEKPSRFQLQQLTPIIGKILSMPGDVRLRCKVSQMGILKDCTIKSEHPAGLGFGAAAGLIAELYRSQPVPVSAVPMPSVDLSIHFPEFPITPPPIPDQPALDKEVAPAQLELSMRVLAAAKFDTEIEQQFQESIKSFDDLKIPVVDAGVRSQIRTALQQGQTRSLAAYKNIIAQNMARLYTETELTGMLGWHQSPAAATLRKKRQKIEAGEVAIYRSIYVEAGRRAGINYCVRHGCSANMARRH